MTIALDSITPCLYAFSQEIALRVVRENKATLRAILEFEDTIYRRVFASYRFSLQERTNRGFERGRFLERVWEEGQIAGADEQSVKELCRPAFDYYWRFASASGFWLPASVLMEYRDFLEKWQTEAGPEISEQDYHIVRLQDILQR